MSIKGNAGFAPFQIPFIRRVGTKAAEIISKRQIIQVTIWNIINSEERVFFLFKAPKDGIILSGTAITNLSFNDTDLTIKIRKGTGRVEENPPIFTDITNGTMIIPEADSFFGEYSECTPSGNNSFEEGEFVSLAISGGVSVYEVTGSISIEIGWI